VRAPTPSAAAELATPDRGALLHRVAGLDGRLAVRITRTLDRAREALDLRRAALRRGLPSPEAHGERVTALTERSGRAAAAALDRAGERLAAQERQLAALSPVRTLARGYAIVEGERGVVTSARAARAAPPGTLALRFHDGALPVEVRDGPPPRDTPDPGKGDR